MGRIYAEDIDPQTRQTVDRNFQPLLTRFTTALRRALPGMSDKELAWKTHFMFGAMAYTMITSPALCPEAADEPLLAVVKRLVTFVSAGFREPVPLSEPADNPN
jgi:hypothetical protein